MLRMRGQSSFRRLFSLWRPILAR